MASAPMLCFALIFVSFFVLMGNCQSCELSDIKVTQSATGLLIQGKPEYEVVVSNGCICSQTSLMIKCAGFQSVERVDPAVFGQDGADTCVINNGLPLYGNQNVSFKYAWDTKFNLVPVSSQVSCS